MPMHGKGLVKLNEECGELIVESSKLQAYPTGAHPDGRGDLKVRLSDEIGDVLAAIDFVVEHHGLDWAYIRHRSRSKKERFDLWKNES